MGCRGGSGVGMASMNLLFAAIVAANALDVGSTRWAIAQGAHEANPLYGSHPHEAVMYTVKSAATVVELAEVRHLWRTGHRRAAIWTTIGVVALNTAVGAHNIRVGSGLKRGQ